MFEISPFGHVSSHHYIRSTLGKPLLKVHKAAHTGANSNNAHMWAALCILRSGLPKVVRM
jgi:hypothetical protein